MAASPSRCRSSTRRPRYFAEVIAELLFWIGPDKILFGSDYAIWTPRWLVEKFWAFELPEDIAQGARRRPQPTRSRRRSSASTRRGSTTSTSPRRRRALAQAPIALAAE